jgi:glycine/D-amino acid oxidase-like deaminating enzyme
MFTSDFKSIPYWWDQTPRPVLAKNDLPRSVDVAVVGSGYTGLHAALVTARGGRSTLVLDAEDAGFGCSTRNGGQISTSVKPSLGELTRRYGRATAEGVIREGQGALTWLAEFVAREQIQCDFKVPGRFHAAHSARAFDKLVAGVQNQPKGFEVPYTIVPRADQAAEIGTEGYHGGVVFEAHASLDPARYHQGLLERALSSGAEVAPFCRVEEISATGRGFRLRSARGEVLARDVVIATNGYSSGLTPWLQRRVIPIGSYVIATEPMEPALMDQALPTERIVSDSRRVVYYYRPSPDRRRILFGGRVSSTETDTDQSGRRLKRDLDRLFPALEGVKVSHSWMGFVAYNFETLANTGQRDGMYYAMGYCGSGVSMASYLGMRTGQKVLGLAEGRTAFDEVPMRTRPLYTGTPWFLPATVAGYRLLDRIGL